MIPLLSDLRAAMGRLRDRRALEGRFPGCSIDCSAVVRSPEHLALGAGVVIDHGALLHCGGMEWAPGGHVEVGPGSYIGPNAVLFGAGGIRIGAHCLISPGVVITSHQHTFTDRVLPMAKQPLDFGEVVLEDDVWIGSNATVLPGVRIGRGAIVGAGAVVVRDIPAGAVALGVPARRVRDR